MREQIETAVTILSRFLLLSSTDKVIDREQIVAHATLAAFTHHWPSLTTQSDRTLLIATGEIKAVEHSRWLTQRRIALAKLARVTGSD